MRTNVGKENHWSPLNKFDDLWHSKGYLDDFLPSILFCLQNMVKHSSDETIVADY